MRRLLECVCVLCTGSERRADIHLNAYEAPPP